MATESFGVDSIILPLLLRQPGFANHRPGDQNKMLSGDKAQALSPAQDKLAMNWTGLK